MNEGQILFYILLGLFGLYWLYLVFGAIDRFGRTAYKVDGVAIKAWRIRTNRVDTNLRIIYVYYAKVEVDGIQQTVRIYEGDYDHLNEGQQVICTVVVGNTGRLYILEARPKN